MSSNSTSQQTYTQNSGVSTSPSPWIDVRDPTTQDVNFPIGKNWINTADKSTWYLNDLTTFGGNLQADWILINDQNLYFVGLVVETFTPPGTDPVLPDGSGDIYLAGSVLPAGTTTSVIQTSSELPNRVNIGVQVSQAVGSSDIGVNGVCHFSNTYFSVDSNGFVQFTGGGVIENFTVDVASGTGVNPVVPDMSGNITITGAMVPASTTTNCIQIETIQANKYQVEVQISQAVASSTIGDNGVSHFDSTAFAVDSNGFVTLIAPPQPLELVQQVFTSSGTYTPTAGMRYCSILCVGGGGGGGGSVALTGSGLRISGGGGGGAGGASQLVFSAGTIGASQAVTIGAGGAGGSGGTGTAGGTSSVGSLITATGGNPGTTGNGLASIGSGGTGGTGNLATGGTGTTSMPLSAGTFSWNSGGIGGSSYTSGSTRNTYLNIAGSTSFGQSVNGQTGISNGGGGGGAISLADASATTSAGVGGTGGTGIVIITDYVS